MNDSVNMQDLLQISLVICCSDASDMKVNMVNTAFFVAGKCGLVWFS